MPSSLSMRIRLGVLTIATWLLGCSSATPEPTRASAPPPPAPPAPKPLLAQNDAPRPSAVVDEAPPPEPPPSPEPPPRMALIPAGPYWTGCDPADDSMCREDEGPWRQITLDAYYIDVYETTVDDYSQCVKAGTCDDRHLSGFEDAGGTWHETPYCNYGKADKGKHPLNCVSWNQANTYCQWAGKRLPTEAEWEKAARGGADKRRYPWGDEPITCDYAVTNEANDQAKKGCGVNSTFPIGSKPKGQSPYGVQDIVGNVWEWTADWYDPTYKLTSQPSENPKGPATGEHKIGKGGCWGSGNPWNSRISWRHHYAPGYRSNVRLGFRCAKSI